jgi:hypothetical protein
VARPRNPPLRPLREQVGRAHRYLSNSDLADSQGWSGSGPDILLQWASFFHASPLYLFRLTYLPESDATDLDPEIKAKLEHLESILADLPREVQQLFTDGVLTQAKALRTAMQRKDQAGSEGQQS